MLPQHPKAAAAFAFNASKIKKARTNKHKVKSLAHLFKGGRFPKGGAIWSSSAEDETRLLTVKSIKTKADKL